MISKTKDTNMPLPTQVSSKMTDVEAKIPYAQKDMTSLMDHCASMMRVEHGLIEENIVQCSDWLKIAEEIVEKAAEREKAVC